MTAERRTSTAITATAESKKRGLTLGELGAAVQDAHRAGLGRGARVEVAIGWSRQIQQITILGDITK